VFATTWFALVSLAAADWNIVHVVRPTETLASIAEHYYGQARRESVLVSENGLTSQGGSPIVVGLRLDIPAVAFHRVQEGETWSALAKLYYGEATRAYTIIEANEGAPGDHPDVGAELLIPYPVRHVVGQSDTLRSIAKLYYNDEKATAPIRRFNNIKRNALKRGQILLVPIADLGLTEAGKAAASEQQQASLRGGEIRNKQARIADELPVLREHVRRGRFADAVAMGNRLLGEGDLTGNQMVTIQRELGTAYVALGSDGLAVAAFVQALSRQADLELDTARTSPKVLTQFQHARQQFQRERDAAAQRELQRSPEPLVDGGVHPEPVAPRPEPLAPATP
jgi:LysM repeat protein